MHFENDYDIISSSDFECLFCAVYQRLNLDIFQCSKTTDADTIHSVRSFCDCVHAIITSSSFNSDVIKKRKLLFCEAYVLLWHRARLLKSSDGTFSRELKVGTVAAMMIDLHVRNKILLTECSNTLSSSDRKSTLVVRVTSTDPTCSFLDHTLFEQISRDAQGCNFQPRKLSDWLNIMNSTGVVNKCFQNLISRGILSSSYLASTKDYSIVNFSIIHQLEKEIKSVCLNERKPDSFILSIMTFSFEDGFSFLENILRQICTSREIKVGMENMKTIVKSQGRVLKSPKFVRKKFSVDRPHHHSSAKSLHKQNALHVQNN